MDSGAHWEGIYRTKLPAEVSWYRPHLEVSLQLIGRAAESLDARVIDVGGGESTLVDDLLALGYYRPTVLDISATALAVAQARLGRMADAVDWLCGDVTTVALDHHIYDVWHDRAVFHFLTVIESRAAYVQQVAHAVRPGGHVIVATFGPEGPTKCSGLDVVRYDPNALHAEFGSNFELVEHLTELHQTPNGAIQQFTYCYCNITAM